MRKTLGAAGSIFLVLAAIMFGNLGTAKRAHSQEALRLIEATGLFCDTREQVERYLSLEGRNLGTQPSLEIVEKVNAEAGKEACGVLTVMLTLTDDLSFYPVNDKMCMIVKVEVRAVLTAMGWYIGRTLHQYSFRLTEMRRSEHK